MDSEFVKKISFLNRKEHFKRHNTNKILNEVKKFLPLIAKANDDLKLLNGKDVNIEIEDHYNKGPIIHLNLALMPLENVSSEDEYYSDYSSSQTSSDEESKHDKELILSRKKFSKPHIEEILKIDQDSNENTSLIKSELSNGNINIQKNTVKSSESYLTN